MYRETSDTLQGKQREQTIRFKQNLIFNIFISLALGIVLSFYIDIFTGTVALVSGLLITLLLKQRKLAIICAALLIGFIRTYYFSPTEIQLRNAEAMGVPIINKQCVEYDFPFQRQLAFIHSIPTRVLGERGGYVAGVMFGDKSNLNKEVKEAFRNAGISHILAVSGLHAGIVMGAVSFCLAKLKRAIRLPLLYCSLALLIILSGFSPSVLRAGLMMGIFIISDTFGFRYNLLNSLMLSGTIILISVPYTMFNIGFILSFTATLGIALFYADLYGYLKAYGEYIGGGIAMYVACQITTLPVMILFFGEISVLGILGNLFTIPIVSFALIFGMVGLVLYPFGISYYAFSFSAAFMEIIEYIAKVIGSAVISVIGVGTVPIFFILIYYLIIGLCCILVFKKRQNVYLYLGGMLGIILFLGIAAR